MPVRDLEEAAAELDRLFPPAVPRELPETPAPVPVPEPPPKPVKSPLAAYADFFNV